MQGLLFEPFLNTLRNMSIWQYANTFNLLNLPKPIVFVWRRGTKWPWRLQTKTWVNGGSRLDFWLDSQSLSKIEDFQKSNILHLSFPHSLVWIPCRWRSRTWRCPAPPPTWRWPPQYNVVGRFLQLGGNRWPRRARGWRGFATAMKWQHPKSTPPMSTGRWVPKSNRIKHNLTLNPGLIDIVKAVADAQEQEWSWSKGWCSTHSRICLRRKVRLKIPKKNL